MTIDEFMHKISFWVICTCHLRHVHVRSNDRFRLNFLLSQTTTNILFHNVSYLHALLTSFPSLNLCWWNLMIITHDHLISTPIPSVDSVHRHSSRFLQAHLWFVLLWRLTLFLLLTRAWTPDPLSDSLIDNRWYHDLLLIATSDRLNWLAESHFLRSSHNVSI